LDVFSLQVSLAAPYPGTELYEMAKQNGWFVKKDKTDLVESDGLQTKHARISRLGQRQNFRGSGSFLSHVLSAAETDLRIIKTMLETKIFWCAAAGKDMSFSAA